MAINIEVRQREVVVVEGRRLMGQLDSLYTLGFNPCIALAVWHDDFCAMGHFDDLDAVGQFAQLVPHIRWMTNADDRRVTIWRAQGARVNEQVHSLAMSKALSALLDIPFAVKDIRAVPPTANHTSSRMKLTVSTGRVEYQFDTPQTVKPERLPAPDATGWPNRIPLAYGLTIGTFEGGQTIRYERAA